MRRLFYIGVLCMAMLGLILAAGCTSGQTKESTKMNEADTKIAKATFAGGCFWCMEPAFEELKGIQKVTVGYTGGHIENPRYEDVVTGKTGHAEAIRIEFDPEQVRYEQLLEIYWHNIDPTQKDGQFFDRGTQYRTAIFYHDEAQRKAALQSKEALAQSGRFDKPIVTEIVPAQPFYAAEEYHQNYHEKNPLRYQIYKKGSGREGYLKSTWGDKTDPP